MSTAARPLELLSRAVQHPRKIVPYLLKKAYPEQYASWRQENGVVTWNAETGFDWGEGHTAPQISAIDYHTAQALREDLRGNRYRHAVDIGCGYGRVTPWLLEYATRVTGVDPNRAALALLEDHYPNADVDTVGGIAQALPLDDGVADLLFTKAVLQHVPPDEIETAVAEMKRIASDDAHILVCEATAGRERGPFHPRPVERYESLFEPFTLDRRWQRPAPATTREYTRGRMLFTPG
jgi:SAM-dependent methyltransferase